LASESDRHAANDTSGTPLKTWLPVGQLPLLAATAAPTTATATSTSTSTSTSTDHGCAVNEGGFHRSGCGH